MTLLSRAIVLLAAAVGTEGVVFVTLQRNLAAGTYPVESDSIGLPLIASGFVLLDLVALVAVGFLYASRSRWLARLGTVSLAVAALFAVLYGLAWADPDHWPIAISFCVLALAIRPVATVSPHRTSESRAT